MYSLLLLGCAEPMATHADGRPAALRVDEGTPEAVGLLAFLADAATTEALLDVDVALDRRAAESIVDHRDGPDGLRGTVDDDPLDTVAEVDACYWVGQSAIDALLAWADAHDFVPVGDDLLGVYDGVSFTVDQATETIAFVNEATDQALDDDVPLDRRAVDSIVAARPIDTVLELSQLYYVGSSALALLQQASVPALPADEDCAPAIGAFAAAAATDFTRLLELATTSDLPFAEVNTFTVTGCSPFADDPVRAAVMVDAVWNDAFGRWDWDGLPDGADESTAWAPGGVRFAARVDRALAAVEEHVADGSWVPEATVEGADLYARRDELVAEMLSGVTDVSFVDVDLHVEASEASEDAAVLIDLRTGDAMALHEFSGA